MLTDMGELLRRLRVLLLIAAVVVLGCTTPTSDPDAKVKALITSTTWETDTVNYPNSIEITIRFTSGGGVYLDGDVTQATWTYQSKVFTIVGPLGTFSTTAPDIAADHFYFNYGEEMCYTVPLGTQGD